jgi:hypothetical protein
MERTGEEGADRASAREANRRRENATESLPARDGKPSFPRLPLPATMDGAYHDRRETTRRTALPGLACR